MKMFMIYDGLIPEEVNVWSSLVLWNIFPVMIEVQGLPQDLDTASCHPTFHRVGLKYFFGTVKSFLNIMYAVAIRACMCYLFTLKRGAWYCNKHM